MISCKRATELISKSMDEPLTAKEQLSLKLHNFLCEFCEQFQRQLHLLRAALGAKGAPNSPEDEANDDPAISERAKARVKEKLSSILNRNRQD